MGAVSSLSQKIKKNFSPFKLTQTQIFTPRNLELEPTATIPSWHLKNRSDNAPWEHIEFVNVWCVCPDAAAQPLQRIRAVEYFQLSGFFSASWVVDHVNGSDVVLANVKWNQKHLTFHLWHYFLKKKKLSTYCLILWYFLPWVIQLFVAKLYLNKFYL